MPFALPAAATAIAQAAPAAAAAAAKVTLMSTLKSVAFNVLTNVAISAAMSALQPQVGAAGRTFEWTLDPDGPIPFAAGRLGVAGSVIYRETFGPDLMYYGLPTVLSGSGPIDGYEAFKADDENVTFDGSGKAVSSQYAGELWFKTTLGNQPDVALQSPSGLKSGVSLPGWSSSHKLSGKAAYLPVMGENSKGSAFPTGEIKPLVTFRGLKGWDPRLDSTYPGGVGSCRLANPATWVFLTNPILWGLKWSLGLWEGPTGKGAPQVDYQVGGIGAKLSGVDVPAFVAAANVADANGWTCAAYPTTDDDKAAVLDSFLQAGGAIYAQRAGKISCLQRAAPRTSVVTITGADTAGPLEIDTAASRLDRINTIRPRYWAESARWQMLALPDVTAQAYQDQDGARRTRPLDFNYVTNPVQAAQLAALQIAHTREGIAGVIPLRPHLQRIRPGDAFTITERDFVLDNVKCLCLNTEYDPQTGVVRVSFVTETDAKYPFALGQSPIVPVPPVLTPVDPRFVEGPLPGDWTITPRPPATGGGQVPGFDLSGGVSNATATAVIVEYGPAAVGPWKQVYQGPPTVSTIPIDGLQPGQTYYVAVQYQRNQNYSDRYIYGPYTAPGLVADDVSPTSPTITDINARVDELFEAVDGATEGGASAEAAAASAAAAAAARDAAQTAAGVAHDEQVAATSAALASAGSATASAGSATVASSKADEAAGSASAANASATAAQASNVASGNSANAAALSATAAGASATEAGSQASAANAQRVLAETARGGAEAAQTSAATSASNASGSASTATSAATTAASARDTALGYRDTAGGYASAAAGSASTASASQSAAGASAAAASASEITANTYAANALAYRDSAAASMSGAAGFSSSAQTSAVLAARVGAGNFANATPTFALGDAGWVGGLPNGWGDWDTGAAHTIVQGQISDKATRWVVPAGVNRGISVNSAYSSQMPMRPGPGWWVAQFLVTAETSGALVGSGGLLQTYAGGVDTAENQFFKFALDPDATGVVQGAGSAGKTYSFSYLFKLDNAATDQFIFYAMPAWDQLGTLPAKTIIYHLAGMRRADAAEIETGQARNGYSTVSARISAEESVRATETAALSSRASTTEARARLQANIIPNAGGKQGARGWAQSAAGGFIVAAETGEGPIFYRPSSGYVGDAGFYTASFPVYGGAQYSFQAEIRQIGLTAGSVRAYLAWINASGTVLDYTVLTVGTSDPQTFLAKKIENYTSPGGAVRAVANIDINGATFSSGGQAAWKNLKLELGSICTAWTDEATDVNLSARTSITESSVADAQSKLNVARLVLLAEAAGSTPALIGLLSGLYGSSIAFSADKIWFGGSIFFEPSSRTLQTLASGGQRRVIGAGFGVDGLLDEWRGPASIAVADMTVSNSVWAVKSLDGKTYYGGTEIAGGNTFTASAPTVRVKTQVGGSGAITTTSVPITVAGNTGAVDYTWTAIFGDVGSMSVSSSTSGSPTFSSSIAGVGRVQVIWAWTAHDAGTGITRAGQTYVTIQRDA